MQRRIPVIDGVAPRARVNGKEVRAWIAERNDVPVAYARCTSVQRRHVLDVMFVPGHLEDMAALIDQVVILLERKQPVSRMYCAVRGYTTELERVLLDRQFRPWLSQRLTSGTPRLPSAQLRRRWCFRMPKRSSEHAAGFRFTWLAWRTMIE